MSSSTLDPITTSVVEHALASVTDEMATVLISTAYSPLVRDLLDFTVALCNPRGEMVVQGARHGYPSRRAAHRDRRDPSASSQATCALATPSS